ncbi:MULTISPECIES: LuxR family transcriptional regulator [Nitrobacteraceae]|jgi:LuxR family transcriptional regulator, activator of conjugal transfer of Ti plasmids|nr:MULTISPECIES: LuxR family transcriptional regulator [Nitrobacteraceae]MBB1090298.1 LuxR family transcriptional regulator [Rhodopseudomonas palustris]MBN9597328.1 LuxR family transcriptional regulator [Afipia sp.]MDD1571385.1 LuxR family transcriptional regulator [Bradyrhizobium sp. WBOS1]PSO25386.1 LuxR family transcriptional regulator [Bradyrhizobium sp. MOS004]RTM12918.1 MAG: LuxR family transcriptional regulator [Bradyrhizobiaceae bacterium]TXH18623.1 MAG: LuxR family transcriptional re
MHRIFQDFIDHLSSAEDQAELSGAMAVTAAALDLSCFAYLALPQKLDGTPRLMSTYPKEWTSHYLRSHYERIDPVIMQALRDTEPFRWGIGSTERYLSPAQKRLLDEASQYGIRLGFTVPIHDGHGPVAAVTFAGNQREAQFERFVTSNPRMLQLMAMFFHSHVRRKLASDLRVDGAALSAREFECLEWAARGKSAWDIGRILGISHHTAISYLNNAKAKLGVRTVVQAALRVAAAKREQQN